MTDSVTKFCVRCNQHKPLSAFKNNGSGKKLRNKCHTCESEKWRAQVKLDVFSHFGVKCACCGEQNILFLTLDHVNGVLSGYRNGKNKEQIYRDVIKDNYDPTKYQLLCMNCNFAKGQFGECPHKSGKTAVMTLAELVQKVA